MMPFDVGGFHMNEGFEYESPQSLLYKFYRQEPVRCSSCGTTYRYFLQSGKFGCSRCYEIFATQLKQEVLPRMQRSNRYVGRKYGTPCHFASNEQKEQALNQPTNQPLNQPTNQAVTQAVEMQGEAIINLQHLLKEAVQREDYEAAARLRDEIAILKKIKQKGGEE